MADSLRVRKLKARRKRAADELRWLVRLFLKRLRHGDYDSMLPLLEAQFRVISRMEKP